MFGPDFERLIKLFFFGSLAAAALVALIVGFTIGWLL